MGLIFLVTVLGIIIIFAFVALMIPPFRGYAIAWLLVILVAIVTILRIFVFVTDSASLGLYALLVGAHYLVVFFLALGLYQDPVIDTGQIDKLKKEGRRLQLLFTVPVYKEEKVTLCVQSILKAAVYVREIADVHVVVIDDASPDDTWHRLLRYAGKLTNANVEILTENGLGQILVPNELSNVSLRLMHLSENSKKKGALAAGMCGGENWQDTFVQFKNLYGREPNQDDSGELFGLLEKIGCHPIKADFVFHTDSDSIVQEEYIYLQMLALLSNTKIGAVSGHCDVWTLGSDSFVTLAQEPLYEGNFRVRKAAEGKTVFCVSGPGAAFRYEAIMPVLLIWVNHHVLGQVYPGATDRKLTIEILKKRWYVLYSYLARVYTRTPSSLTEYRSQSTRWKMNFWAVLIDVLVTAPRVCTPAVVFLKYSGLIITILAPIILWYHISLILEGKLLVTLAYLAGIMAMGIVWGIVGLRFSQKERNAKQKIVFVCRRVAVAFGSAVWGSPLTLRALFLHLKRGFTWRDAPKSNKRGRLINRWFRPTFELRFYEAIIMFELVSHLIRLLS